MSFLLANSFLYPVSLFSASAFSSFACSSSSSVSLSFILCVFASAAAFSAVLVSSSLRFESCSEVASICCTESCSCVLLRYSRPCFSSSSLYSPESVLPSASIPVSSSVSRSLSAFSRPICACFSSISFSRFFLSSSSLALPLLPSSIRFSVSAIASSACEISLRSTAISAFISLMRSFASSLPAFSFSSSARSGCCCPLPQPPALQYPCRDFRTPPC